MWLLPIPFMVYVVAVTVMVVPIAWAWRARASWEALELLTGAMPFVVWVLFFFLRPRGKTMSNLLFEPICLTAALSLIVCLRVGLAPKLGSSRAAAVAAWVAMLSGWAVWWAVPGFPE